MICSRIRCIASFLLLGSCYTMADHAFVFGLDQNGNIGRLKGGKKKQTSQP